MSSEVETSRETTFALCYGIARLRFASLGMTEYEVNPASSADIFGRRVQRLAQ
jgi:hypothetical protein